MRQFASSRFRLWNLSRPAKIVYSFFCGLSLLAILSSVLLYEDLVGPSLRSGHVVRVEQYYGKNPVSLAAPTVAPQSPTAQPVGPEIAIPEEDSAPSMTLSMPYRKLLEVTHFHLFTIPVFVLILTHLFLMTESSLLSHMVWISMAWLSALLHIVAPWLIRFGTTKLSLLFPLSGAGLFASCLWLTVYPVWVMWRGKPTPTPVQHGSRKQEIAPPFSD